MISMNPKMNAAMVQATRRRKANPLKQWIKNKQAGKLTTKNTKKHEKRKGN